MPMMTRSQPVHVMALLLAAFELSMEDNVFAAACSSPPPGIMPSNRLTKYSLSGRRSWDGPMNASRPYRIIRTFRIGMDLTVTPNQLTTLRDVQRSSADSTEANETLCFFCEIALKNIG